jgi:predicted nucleotidyltransferase
MKNYTEQYKNIILPIIIKHIPNAKVILYGSRARQDAHEGSDIDIALDTNKKIDSLIISMIIGDVEESNLPISFDIVDFHAVSKQLQDEILKDGIIWKK